ncbi:hypothetical protein [Pseudogemmobacter blasticus]|uniref:Flagellar protein FlgN n=1 Tax=Fuscovulum blasticum DSM 2131 TaxID=1188250 RepID=A0A2T4JFQ5_FUSBL|nr:hypothetical protein [Fuscovulum blasticum]PTE16648.1 hypothetical protein C5F44_02005 [Fuscovulum blasticum DSM 2131]
MTGTPLETLLEDTRKALFAGDLARLAALAGETEQALFAGIAADAATAPRLRQLAEANRPLLAAAIRGVKSAQRRASEVAGHGRFSTYDSRGQRGVIGPAPTAPACRW